MARKADAVVAPDPPALETVVTVDYQLGTCHVQLSARVPLALAADTGADLLEACRAMASKVRLTDDELAKPDTVIGTTCPVDGAADVYYDVGERLGNGQRVRHASPPRIGFRA